MINDKKLRFIEFLLIGVFMGVIEDLLAIAITTEATINFKVLWIVFIIALPFAFLSEVVVDHPRFWANLLPRRKRTE